MILLDTNVISDLMRPRPDPRVEAWIANQPRAELLITAITEAELRFGIEILPHGLRRQHLQTALIRMLEEDFARLILPFDSAAAVAYAGIVADRRHSGRPINSMDAQIAAIARSRSATLATRNVEDFQGCQITIVNPWNSGPITPPPATPLR